MRDSQLQVLDLPYAAVANTIDLGDKTNIHPTDKLPVGQRLALLAAANTLGEDRLVMGPMMLNVEEKGSELVVSFKNAKGLKTSDGKAPSGFWLADESGEWKLAEARLEGESVVLSSEGISEPKYIRYAFAGMPKVNLVNELQLPAYPFRTDSFEY